MRPKSILAIVGIAICALLLMARATGAQEIVPPQPSTTLPRHAGFVLDPAESNMELTLSVGSSLSKLGGKLQLYLGDPSVGVPAVVGLVGLSVDRADLVAIEFEPDLPGLVEPMHLIQSPNVRSIGSWNTITGDIAFELHLIGANTSGAGLPVPMPVRLNGNMLGGILKAVGSNGNSSDASLRMRIKAFETPLPPHVVDVWFSTNTGFHPGRVSSDVVKPPFISDGDLLSVRGYVVRTNGQLLGRMGIMPPTPDLGLDAVLASPGADIWFSFKRSAGQIWSETLSRWISHGDLLSERGQVIMTNAQMLAKFAPAVSINKDFGLDALHRGANRELVFSVDEGFHSASLNRWIGHGDLLSIHGRVVRTNAQLLSAFKIVDHTLGPLPRDYGLDAVAVRSNSEIWFSTAISFTDERFGWVSDGDLLSSSGYIVARNLQLLAGFQPTDNLGNFGLDALTWSVVCRPGDFDFDGDVDADDLAAFTNALSGPSLLSDFPEVGDLDGDGDSDQTDFGILQRCLSGAGRPASLECSD